MKHCLHIAAMGLVLGYFYLDSDRVDAGTLVIEGECNGKDGTASARDPCKWNPDLRFVVVGDTGRGPSNPGQKWVADAMASYCASQGCQFVHLVGDNIYPKGVTSEDADEQFHAKFHDPYSNVNMPFWAALGNHDYGGDPVVGGHGLDHAAAAAQIAYANGSHNQTEHGNKFRMPDDEYIVRFGPPGKPYSEHYVYNTPLANFGLPRFPLIAPPSDPIYDPSRKVQRPWKFAFGHHPYISNGFHSEFAYTLGGGTSLGTGATQMIEDEICGKADIYFAGHEHDAQMLMETCGPDNGKQTQLAIIGTGHEALGRSPDPSIVLPFLHANLLYDDTAIGFLWVNANDDTVTLKFIGCDRYLHLPTVPTDPETWCANPDHIGDDHSLGTEWSPWYTLFAMECTRSPKKDTGLQNCEEIQPDRTPNMETL